MNKNKSQHYNFSHEAIPILWHKETSHFLTYIAKDGIAFLRFYWKHIKENLGAKIESSSDGLDYSIKELSVKNNKILKIIILTLPKPQEIGEVYYMALVKLPDKKTFADLFMIHLPTTKVYTLELAGYDENKLPLTNIMEITPRTRNIKLREGTQPNFKLFYDEILKEIHVERL